MSINGRICFLSSILTLRDFDPGPGCRGLCTNERVRISGFDAESLGLRVSCDTDGDIDGRRDGESKLLRRRDRAGDQYDLGDAGSVYDFAAKDLLKGTGAEDIASTGESSHGVETERARTSGSY